MARVRPHPPAGPPHAGRRRAAPFIGRLAMLPATVRTAVAAAARPPLVVLVTRLAGTVSTAGSVTAGPLGAGAEYALAGSGRAASGPRGRMRLATALRVAVGPDPAGGTVRLVLTDTLTWPGGDRLTLLRVVDAEHDGAGRLRGAGRWTVIGGTGRFAQATGSGDGDLRVDLPGRRFSGALAGRVALA